MNSTAEPDSPNTMHLEIVEKLMASRNSFRIELQLMVLLI
ncbi:Uncharacterised protein [Klebsiella pneumoniae]|nr:Uncharacterised protein [Klebsiella pneumoniae]